MLKYLSFIVFLLFSKLVFAEENFYIVALGNYLKPDKNTKSFDGFGSGLAIGKELNSHVNIELHGFWQNYNNDYSCCKNVKVDLDGESLLTGATVDIEWFFKRSDFSPYLVSAFGGMNTNYKMQAIIPEKTIYYEKNTSSFIFEAGIGENYSLTNNLSLRADIRYRLNTFPSVVNDKSNNLFNDLVVNFGLSTPF